MPDDGGQTEGRFEHGEVIADAGPRPTAERQVLPAIPALGVFRAESVGVEHQRVVPQGGIAMHGVDPDRHHGAGFDPVAVDVEVLHRHPGSRGRRWAQAQRLVQHLDRVPQPGNVLGGQWRDRPLRRLRRRPGPADRDGDPGPTTRTSGWSPSYHVRPQEDHQFMTNLLVGQRLSRLRVGRGDQRVN